MVECEADRDRNSNCRGVEGLMLHDCVVWCLVVLGLLHGWLLVNDGPHGSLELFREVVRQPLAHPLPRRRSPRYSGKGNATYKRHDQAHLNLQLPQSLMQRLLRRVAQPTRLCGQLRRSGRMSVRACARRNAHGRAETHLLEVLSELGILPEDLSLELRKGRIALVRVRLEYASARHQRRRQGCLARA